MEIEQIKEIIATLNLESETTAQIVEQLMPMLWWTFVWVPLIKEIMIAFIVLTILALFYGLIIKMT